MAGGCGGYSRRLKDGEVKTEFGKCWQKGCDRAIVKAKGRCFVLICRALRGEKCQKDYDLMFIPRVIKLFSDFFIYPLALHKGKVIYYALVRPSGLNLVL